MKTFYEKRGKRYHAVLEKDLWSNGDVWNEGCHLVVCKPGVRTTRYNVQPDDAAFIAAQTIHAEVLAKFILDASAAKPDPTPITPEQKKAWDAFKDSFDGGPFLVRYDSAVEIARRFLDHLREFSRESKND